MCHHTRNNLLHMLPSYHSRLVVMSHHTKYCRVHFHTMHNMVQLLCSISNNQCNRVFLMLYRSLVVLLLLLSQHNRGDSLQHNPICVVELMLLHNHPNNLMLLLHSLISMGVSMVLYDQHSKLVHKTQLLMLSLLQHTMLLLQQYTLLIMVLLMLPPQYHKLAPLLHILLMVPMVLTLLSRLAVVFSLVMFITLVEEFLSPLLRDLNPRLQGWNTDVLHHLGVSIKSMFQFPHHHPHNSLPLLGLLNGGMIKSQVLATRFQCMTRPVISSMDMVRLVYNQVSITSQLHRVAADLHNMKSETESQVLFP